MPGTMFDVTRATIPGLTATTGLLDSTISIDVIGSGTITVPVMVDLTGFSAVGRIEIFNITDLGGIGWDDFTFDVCSNAVEYGVGCPGAGGFVPLLSVDCAIAAGNQTAITIDAGLGGATAVIVFGLAPTSVPMGGGCSFLVTPLFPATTTLPLGGVGPGNGSAVLVGLIPPGTTGVQFTTQVFVIDPSTGVGFSNSTGRLVTIG